jgi:hypothetical protein
MDTDTNSIIAQAASSPQQRAIAKFIRLVFLKYIIIPQQSTGTPINQSSDSLIIIAISIIPQYKISLCGQPLVD